MLNVRNASWMRSLVAAGLFVCLPVGAEEDHGSVKADVKDAAHRTGKEIKKDAKVVGKTVKEAAKTTGEAVKDGANTVGRTTKAQIDDGKTAAKKTWKKNAEETKENAEAGGRKVKAAAKGE